MDATVEEEETWIEIPTVKGIDQEKRIRAVGKREYLNYSLEKQN